MNRQKYFNQETYLNYETGYPERPVSWFLKYIHSDLITHITNPQGRLLDVGCASGYFTNEINKIIKSDGVDFSDVRIKAATELFPHITFFQQDLTGEFIDTGGQKYDYFFTNAVIPHIPKETKHIVFKNLAKIANKGAKLVIYDQLVNTGVVDDFVGLFSIEWLSENATDWSIGGCIKVAPLTDRVVLTYKGD